MTMHSSKTMRDYVIVGLCAASSACAPQGRYSNTRDLASGEHNAFSFLVGRKTVTINSYTREVADPKVCSYRTSVSLEEPNWPWRWQGISWPDWEGNFTEL